MKRTIILMMFLSGGWMAEAQILSPKEAQVDSMIMVYIDQNAIIPDFPLLVDTQWQSSDLLGSRSISFFKNGTFKQVNEGSRGDFGKISGNWELYDQYIVMTVKKEKTSLYVVKYNGEIILMDLESIDVTRKLLMEMIVNDQWMGVLTEEEVFGFLTGFKKVS